MKGCAEERRARTTGEDAGVRRARDEDRRALKREVGG
jgi:hypothetical protein